MMVCEYDIAHPVRAQLAIEERNNLARFAGKRQGIDQDGAFRRDQDGGCNLGVLLADQDIDVFCYPIQSHRLCPLFFRLIEG